MKHAYRLLFVFAPLFFLCRPPTLSAQDGLFPNTDARSRFLGGTGLTAEGAVAGWTNPAGLAKTRGLEATAFAEQRFNLSELTTANLAAAYQTGLGGFGLQLASFGFDTYRETRVGVAYGRQLSERFRLGAEFVGFGTATQNYESTFDATFGIGLQLMVLEELHVGARVFSPLRVERLPEEFLPQLLAIGFSYRPTEQLQFNAEVHQDPNFPLRARLGVEYLPAEELSVQIGVVTGATEMSFGLGYLIKDRFRVNAGAVWHEVLGVWPGIGVSYFGEGG